MKIPFLVDECVPKSAGEYLAERGHAVSYVVDVLTAGAADHVVVHAADANASVVVTNNRRDFEKLLRSNENKRSVLNRYRKAGMLYVPQLRCRQRLEKLIELVECEYEMLTRKRSKRFMVAITDSTLKVTR